MLKEKNIDKSKKIWHNGINEKHEEVIDMSGNPVREKEMKSNGTYNYRAEQVRAKIFTENPFFDAHDTMQVKYEMLRAVEKDGMDITAAAEAFGFSRVSYYQIKRDYEASGIAGLAPQKRGPQGSRKITEEDIEYARNLVNTHTKNQILLRLREERGITISRRTLERNLANKKNKSPRACGKQGKTDRAL